MSEASSLLDILPTIAGVLTVGGAAIGATVQYIINSRAEQRQRELANLESDIKISDLFSELVEVANGYKGWTAPMPEVIKIVEKNVPKEMLQFLLQRDPSGFGKLFTGSILPIPTPLARQLAAAESIVNLAKKYPILLEPALVGLDVTAGFSPFAKVAYDRLCSYYRISRPLTNWGPNWQGVGDTPVNTAGDDKHAPGQQV